MKWLISLVRVKVYFCGLFMEELLREWGFEQYANIFKGNNLLHTYLLLCLMHYFDFEVEHNLKWVKAMCVAVN